MASRDIKTPPTLNDGDSYSNWKNDLEIWELYTDLENKRKGPAVFLSLTGEARECIRTLKKTDIGAENGLEKIIAKLDSFYQQDINTRAYLYFKQFYEFRRTVGMSITDFLVKYEFLYHQLSDYEVKLPTGVQAFFLLQALNVSDENERLVRATISVMTYEEMKATILKTFGDSVTSGVDSTPAVKTEPVYKCTHDVGYRSNKNWKYQKKDGNATRLNPKDKNGDIMKCFRCGSTRHLANRCMSKTPQAKDTFETEEIHFTLFTNDKMSPLVQESLGMAVLDSACTKTVMGEVWYEAYTEALSDYDKTLIKSSPSNTKFRFGDGTEVMSNGCVKIPAVIGKRKGYIDADIVSNNIPLLLSVDSMEKAGGTLDFGSRTLNIFNQNVQLVKARTGHLCLPLTNFLLGSNPRITYTLEVSALSNCSTEEKARKAKKLHRQFSHASSDKLCELVRKSGQFNDNEFLKLIQDCCNSCEICQKFKKPFVRPVVSLPLANRFNQVICMDLKEHIHNKSWILHIIDAATRFSAARLISSKKQDVIIENIFSMWICYFGSPSKILTDNGGEFSNESLREMNEKFNIITLATAAESPFSNGIVERHNLILYEGMQKTMIDLGCSAELALAWGVSAKNALHNHGGYCPNQLVFGYNTNTPSICNNFLPALEDSFSSDVVRRNLNALHTARENHIQVESCARIKKALRSQTRTYADQRYESGDSVFYRRQNYKGWKGPGVVIGQEGKVVLVRHGGEFYRVHPCHLMKARNNEPHSLVETAEDTVHPECVRSKKVDDTEVEIEGGAEVADTDPEGEEDVTADTEPEGAEDVAAENNVEVPDLPDLVDEDTNSTFDSTVLPARNSCIRYKLLDSNDWIEAKVMNSQPKRTGGYNNWVNVQNSGARPSCVNWEYIEKWSKRDETGGTVDNVLILDRDQEYKEKVINAKSDEIQKMIDNDVFEVVPYTGQKLVSSRWVITEKINEDNSSKIKTRLVARGFEEDSSEFQTDSPTCSRETLRLVYSVTATKKWNLQTIDFTSAFLQGDRLEREVYLKLPRDVCPKEQVWKLKKCIYGLNDAPRAWYNRIREALLRLGGRVSVYDSAFFLWHDAHSGDVRGVIASHVDDFVFSGDPWFEANVIQKVKDEFKVGRHCGTTFKYLGLDVKQSANGITLDQERYVSELETIEIDGDPILRRDDILNQDEKNDLRKLGGQMMWLTSQSRPDLSYETCMMNNMGRNPTVKMVLEANKAVLKAKSSKLKLHFPNLGDPKSLEVICFSDATYASLPDGSSQGAYIVFLKNGRRVAPISWQSKKLNRVTNSPLGSETLALGEAADAGFLIASMIQEIFNLPKFPVIKCFTDNKSLFSTLKTTKINPDKRLRVDIARIREMVTKKEIVVSWVNGENQLADCLTKRGASPRKLTETLKSSLL